MEKINVCRKMISPKISCVNFGCYCTDSEEFVAVDELSKLHDESYLKLIGEIQYHIKDLTDVQATAINSILHDFDKSFRSKLTQK